MIGSITFTYGDKRSELVEYKSKDLSDKHFRNLLDLNLFLFHNSPTYYYKNVVESKLLDGFKFTFGSISGDYPAALKVALLKLKDKGVRKLFFIQDDAFSCIKDLTIYTKLVNFAKTTSLPYFCIEHFDDSGSMPVLVEGDSFNVLDITTNWFEEKGWWPWDDASYCADIDFILKNIHDDDYFTYPDIWSAEFYLKHKFTKTNTLRPICDKQFFRRTNIVGANSWNRENELKHLAGYFE